MSRKTPDSSTEELDFENSSESQNHQTTPKEGLTSLTPQVQTILTETQKLLEDRLNNELPPPSNSQDPHKVNITVENYNFLPQDQYFKSYRHIWEIATEKPDTIEYDRGFFLLDRFSINEEITFSEFAYLIKKYEMELVDLKDSFSYEDDTPMSEFSYRHKAIVDLSLTILAKESEPSDPEDLKILFEDYCEDSDNIFEALGYWTVYFSPKVLDTMIAYKCKLTPFVYNSPTNHESLELLALSGCGLDLGPKLDAYQALVDGAIDRNSRIFHPYDNTYFRYVMGEEITKEVLKAVTRTRAKVSLEFLIDRQDEE